MHFGKDPQDYIEGSLLAPWVVEYLLYRHLGTGDPTHPYWILGQEIGTRWIANDPLGSSSPHKDRLWRIAAMMATWLHGSTNGVFPGHSVGKHAGQYWHFGRVNARLRAMLPSRQGEPDEYLSRYRHFFQRIETPEGFSLEWSNIYAKSSSEWMFHDLTNYDFLQNREAYEWAFNVHNAKRIAEAIRRYKPAVVAMATNEWRRIEALMHQLDIRAEEFKVEGRRKNSFYLAHTDDTLLVIFSQSRFVSRTYLPRVVEEAARRLPPAYFANPVSVSTSLGLQ